MMEMPLWQPDLSQNYPLPVPACGHRAATLQDSNQVQEHSGLTPTQELRRRALKWEESSFGKTKHWCSPAVPGLFSLSPLHTGTAPAAPGKVSKAGSQTNRSLEGHLYCLNTKRAQLLIL